MILHLSAAGVPVSWAVTAVYGTSYGIAHAAATTWFERSREPSRSSRIDDQPQFVVEVEPVGENGWSVKRSHLMMDASRLARPSHDEHRRLVQWGTGPAVPFAAVLKGVVEAALKAALVEFGWMLPRAEWERRNPVGALTSRRFAEFGAAADAALAAGIELAFERRWTPFMETPDDFHLPWSATPEGSPPGLRCRRVPESFAAPWSHPSLGPDVIRTDKDAEDAARLLNSGWTPEEVAVLLTDPTEQPA